MMVCNFSHTSQGLSSDQECRLIPAQPFHPLIQVNAPNKYCTYPHYTTIRQAVLLGGISAPAYLILALTPLKTIKFLMLFASC